MKSTGMNTATSERLIDTTVKPICRAPFNAACIDVSPFSTKRYTFSITTIASSTTKPTEIVTAISERLSSVKPHRYMIPKVPARESGTVMLAMNVGHARRRKRNTTMTTSAMLMSSEVCTSSTEARIVTVRSLRMSSFTLGGIHFSTCGKTWRMRSTVSMTFASGCLKTTSKTAGFVPCQPPSFVFSTSSTTFASELSRTGVPFFCVSTRSRYSLAFRSCPLL